MQDGNISISWWRQQMEIFSALLSLCAGNLPVTGEFPARRPVTLSFDVFFDLRLNKRLGKQSRHWWFETSPCSLWRHCNDELKYNYIFEKPMSENISDSGHGIRVFWGCLPWRHHLFIVLYPVFGIVRATMGHNETQSGRLKVFVSPFLLLI